VKIIFLCRYSRKTDVPSILFLDVKFHPTMPDHIIVLSSNTFAEQQKINTLVPAELISNMEKDIMENYFNQAKILTRQNNRNGMIFKNVNF
jgi:hypothetical protein